VRLGIVYHMPFWRDAEGTLREVEGSFARYVDSLAPYFDEVVLCVPEMTSARGEGTALRARNVTLAPLPHFDGPAQFYPRLPLFVHRIVRFVRTVDVLHCRIPTPAAVVACAAARLSRTPSFVLVVGDLAALLPSMPYRGVKKALWRAYTAFEERNVQWMVDGALAFANGRALAAKHSRRGREVIETRTTTIREGDIASRVDTCGGTPIRLLTVSRIDPRKGLQVLPAVVAALTARGHDVTLDIVGPTVGAPGAAEAAAIQGEAQRLGVAARVRLAGAIPLSGLLALYRSYDLFVLPTLPGEGIPRVLLESMAAGVPVVTTAVAGIPGLVEHERNGLLIDTPSADAVAAALDRLITDGALRRRLIANGYATARAHTLDAQAADMMRIVASQLGVEMRAERSAKAAASTDRNAKAAASTERSAKA
jgi:glycosyltransferase involved in cell wall biosynthesis